MSTLAERARIEAEAAEAEDGEPEPGEPEPGEPEPEPEPEPEVRLPVAAVELPNIGPDEIRKAENAAKANRRKLAGILGEPYVAHECLMCSTLGFVPELPPPGTTFIVVEDEGGIGLAVEPPATELPLKYAPDKAACDECDGWGEVLSGSRNPHATVVNCSKCMGNGWVMVARDGPQVSVPLPSPAGPPSPEAAAATNGAVDAWGRPAGHIHWGVPPAMVQG